MEFDIILADPRSRSRMDDLIVVLNSYREDPMGMTETYPAELKARLRPGLSQAPGLRVFLGYAAARIAGAAVCFETFSTFMAKPALNVHDLAVLPLYRQAGLGRRLLEAITGYAEAHEMGRVTLEVREDNHQARRLYDRSGFGECAPPMRFLVKKIS